jgi:hypothetical protein
MLIPQERTITAGPFRLRDVHYSAGELHRRHAHDELQISILLRGAMSEEVNGVAYAGCAGDVVVKPAGTMHADAFEPARIICIDADPRLFERDLLPRYGWSRGGVVLLAAMRVVRSFMSGEAAADDVADLLAALPSRPIDDRLLATRAARALEDAFAETVSIEALASSACIGCIWRAPFASNGAAARASTCSGCACAPRRTACRRRASRSPASRSRAASATSRT